MGNPKQKWTCEEEEALRAGVAKHGAGKWKNIQRDPEFNHLLFSRSNIDLKDKWRNLSVANGLNPREKSRSLKPKASLDAPATPLLLTHSSASTDPVATDAPTDAVIDESLKCVLDGKTVSKYNAMIYEALSAMKDPNGSDVSSIFRYIEERHEVPDPVKFRRLLTGRLRRLVGQGKLEKALNGYVLARDILPEAKALTPKPKDIVHHKRLSPMKSSYLGDTMEAATLAAAYKVAEAANASFVAAEAMKEAERVAEMAEDANSFLQLAQEIFDRCSRGETVILKSG